MATAPMEKSSPAKLGRCPEGAEGSRRSVLSKDHVPVTDTTSAPPPAFGHLPRFAGENRDR
jgi:hypothetical protein